MNISKHPASESGYLNPTFVGAIAIFGVALGAAMLFEPAGAALRAPASVATPVADDNASAVVQAAAGDAGYIASQYVNRALQVEPTPELY